MVTLDTAQLDFSIGTVCPPNNPYCGNRDRHVHGSFACETRCPCRSGFSEEARIQAAKPWSYQKTADDYLRKLLSEHFGLNSNSPDYNDQLWINGYVPPISVPEAALRELIFEHFGISTQDPNYFETIRNLPECKAAVAEHKAYDYIELNYEQVQVLVAIKYAIKSLADYTSREGDVWKEHATRAGILRDTKILEARRLGIPQPQIDRFIES
jgi:hypothetical protein